MATVVTAADIQKASQELVDIETDDVKEELTGQFNNGESVIPDSFTIDRAAAMSKPAAGEEASGKATLTSKTTFSMSVIAKSELQAFLKEAINKQLDDSQRIYSDGIDKISLSGFTKNEQGSFVNVASTGQIGPNIDTSSIKSMVKGKQYGDAQAELEAINGVSSADIKFSYFWVTTIPGDDKKIDVEFVIDNA